MKHYFTLFLLLYAFNCFSQTESKKINVQKSTVIWKGKKTIGSAHVGSVKLISGNILFENNIISGGEFLIDMTSIICTDLKGKGKKKIEKHLYADSFFGVLKYPESKFSIKKAVLVSKNTYQITGDFTIKNKTNSNTFLLTISNQIATGRIFIKRDIYDIGYGSGFFGSIANKAISNTFILDFNLTP